jgi:NitT/TauT family transport system permease protein
LVAVGRTDESAGVVKSRITLYRVALLLAALLFWEFGSGYIIDSFWLSKPSLIAASLWGSLKKGELLSDLYITLEGAFYGYVLGSIGGLAFGLFLGQSETLARVLQPFILAIYGIPRIALAPIFVLWFGIALLSKVMMAGMMSFLLVFFSTYEGIRSVDLELQNVARILGANRWQLFTRVTMPNASPWIIAGLRIAIPQALVAAVVAEFIASTAGLGYRIMATTNTMDTSGTMAGIVVLMILVVGLNTILDRVEHSLLKWRPKATDNTNV